MDSAGGHPYPLCPARPLGHLSPSQSHRMPRPSVDIIVPFVGTDADLARVVQVIGRVELAPGDTVTIADNRPTATPGDRLIGTTTVRGAAGQPSSYFARNRGVEGGQNPWLVFLDADVQPEPDLLTAYFTPEPGEEVGLLIGGILDEPAEDAGSHIVARHAHMRGAVGHETTLRDDGFTTAQTANAAVRRSLFEQLGGFTEGIRSGGDAELSIRVQRAGFRLEPRFDAKVLHESRTTLKGFFRQYVRYGAGSQWLEARYPGFSPKQHPLRLGKTLAGQFVRALLAPARTSFRDIPIFVLDSVRDIAFYGGRFASNEVAPHALPAATPPAPPVSSPQGTH